MPSFFLRRSDGDFVPSKGSPLGIHGDYETSVFFEGFHGDMLHGMWMNMGTWVGLKSI